jgi:hypothetical protein
MKLGVDGAIRSLAWIVSDGSDGNELDQHIRLTCRALL